MISVPVGRIVEIANNHRHLSLYRGFMVVTDTATHTEAARIPIDDVAAVIAHSHGLSYTNNLLEALAVRCAPLVLCSNDHNAVAMLVPVDGHGHQAGRFDAQIRAALPTRKRLWAEIVRAKLRQQAAALEVVGAPTAPITALLPRIRSGDTTNVEALAAKRYWPLLYGPGFRRDRAADGINAMLNYGYTILRSAAARAVVAAGLHPTIGLFHSNQGNAMRLADDLMEPFRPLVDLEVLRLHQKGLNEVDPDVKRALAGVLYLDRATDEGTTPLIACINRLATSLSQVFLGERKSLTLPDVSMSVTLPADAAQATEQG